MRISKKSVNFAADMCVYTKCAETKLKSNDMKKFFSLFIALLMAGGLYAEDISVARAIEIGSALTENNVPTTDSYSIVGYVNAITENKYNESYNNMTFWIADTRGTKASTSAGALQCYRCRPDRELEVGDKIRVVAPLKKWNSTVETAQINAPVTWLESGEAVPVLDTIKGSLRVCAQNLENYYYNLNTGRGNYTEAERAAKTRKIVNMMLSVDADIYAFCELEAKPIILLQLADSANARISGTPYTAVTDNIDVDWSESADYNLKSGFIYRSDRVAPVGSSTGGTSGNGYYAHTMRIQTFKQLSNNEKLVVSMNHFKAKDSSSDAGNATRVTNATNLVNSLKNISTDPDILVLGDMNCEYGEEPMNIIANAGYDEQILRFDSAAFSHCYNGGELIDHALANESMAKQIVCAYVKHVSAYKCNASVTQAMSYSDHDPYVVEINLASGSTPVVPDECQDVDETYLTSGLGDMTTEGEAQWKWDNTYNCAKVGKQGGYTGYLLTPAYNLQDAATVSLSFSHAHKYAGTPANELTLWVTKDYKGSFDGSEWQQLTINPYTSNSNFNFSDVSVNVPTDKVGSRTAFAFKYMSTASNYATWEIKNLNIKATCGQTALEQLGQDKPQAIRFIHNGQLYIQLTDGSTYTITGQKIQ